MTALVGYGIIYASQSAALARSRSEFLLTACPVCKTGNLAPDVRYYRVLGIPRARRTIRCDSCRSVLRQVGTNQWRYAVDGAANPELFQQLNGTVVDDADLRAISPDYQGITYEDLENDEPPT